MATVRPRVMAMPERVTRDLGPVIIYSVDLLKASLVAKMLSFIPGRESAESNLAYAGVLVPRGLWLGYPGQSPARRSACRTWRSRPSVQKGRLTCDGQIGQAGKTASRVCISPPVFSGGVQHRVGVEGTDLIIGNNTPIFLARIGSASDASQFMAVAHSRIACAAIAAFATGSEEGRNSKRRN